jgi:hypothetical protein
MHREVTDVFGPFPQGRHPDLHHVHTVKQVLPERALLHLLLQVPVGCGNDPDVGLDRAFAIDGLAECVHDAAQQTFANGHREQLAGRLDLLAFLHRCVVAENDRPDLGFFEVEREAGDAVAKVEHLVEHGVGETFDFGHAVADFADGANVLFAG